MSIKEYTWVQQPRGTVPLDTLLKMRAEGTAKIEGGRIYFYQPMQLFSHMMQIMVRNHAKSFAKRMIEANRFLGNLIDKT